MYNLELVKDRKKAYNWLLTQGQYTVESDEPGIYFLWDNWEAKQVSWSYTNVDAVVMEGWNTVGGRQLIAMSQLERTVELSRREVEALAKGQGVDTYI